jgi:DNA-directed RNA polymerase specialized sigma subunit
MAPSRGAGRRAGRYANGRVPFDDLAQVAGIGLLKATERFDPDRDVPFAAFARIMSEIGKITAAARLSEQQTREGCGPRWR